MPTAERQHRSRTILAFALVYFFWGSTYLGIAIAVEHIGAPLMGGLRFFTAGTLMLLWCALSGRRVRVTLGDAARLAVIGILLLSIANVVLGWAEETVPTGLAALIVSITPLWFLVIETWILRGDHLSRRGVFGLMLGIVGIVVLLWPKLQATTALGHKELFACLALLGGSIAWAIGSVLSKRWATSADAFVGSAWQMIFAGIVNFCVAAVAGNYHTANFTARGVAAIAYLVVFGSWVGFSAYIWLLQNVPMPKVATYAYVNPVVAVILGWLAWHGWIGVTPTIPEEMNRYIISGTFIIVIAVALVTSAKVRTKQGTLVPEADLPAVESAGD
jgi:drug/metabolite transporter (DMT)-like permease